MRDFLVKECKEIFLQVVSCDYLLERQQIKAERARV